MLSLVVLVEWVGYWSVWYFKGIVYFGFWCTSDLEVKYVKLNLRSNCMSTDIVIVFVIFAGPIRGYSPDGRVNNFTRTVAGGIATSMTQRNAATTQRNTTQHNTTQYRGARWLSGRVSDSGARGRGFETYRRRVVSLSKTLYSPKVLVNYRGSGGSVPT